MADVVYIGGETLAPSARYLHKADVLRATPYASFGGQEGVGTSGSMKVVEGATPGGFVDINPGVVAVLGRGPAQTFEIYVAKEETQQSVAIDPTDSSSGRSDLVILRVVDPEDGPAGDTPPSDTVNGPYAFYEVIKGVDPNTEELSDTFATHGVRAGFALARVDLPASTATVTGNEIVRLRRLATPLSDGDQAVLDGPSTTETVTAADGIVPLPSTAHITVRVPLWATKMNVDITCKPMRLHDPTAGSGNEIAGRCWLYVDGVLGQLGWWHLTFNGPFNELWTGIAESRDVSSYQGQDVTLQVAHDVTFSASGQGEIQAYNQSQTVLRWQFGQELT